MLMGFVCMILSHAGRQIYLALGMFRVPETLAVFCSTGSTMLQQIVLLKSSSAVFSFADALFNSKFRNDGNIRIFGDNRGIALLNSLDNFTFLNVHVYTSDMYQEIDVGDN